VVAALPWLITSPYWRGILIVCAMNVLLALSLNLVLGYTGQLNLGQSAFFGIGAYVSTILVKTYGWNFWLACVAAVGAAGLLGLALAARSSDDCPVAVRPSSLPFDRSNTQWP